ncbi:hypothetical protein POM88_019790 [Heracleum sosnowskyi]|uniref:Uncharacterized protein n=1 Tax=Heracleum sosnowskyi TaxID=360622 RepID=A0AAD8IAS8_9APIA|nr:hypothetical protein POM88_019790 [Heracleum sosnowskyi]
MYIAVENGYDEIVEIISTTCTAPSFDGPYGSTVVRINDLDQDESPGGTLYKILDADTVFDAAIARDADYIARLEMEADKLNYYGETILHVESELAPSLEGPERSTALHAFISNMDEAKEENKDVTIKLIDAAKKWSSTEEGKNQWLEAFFSRTDEDGLCLLELAAGKNDLGVVKLLLENDPAYRRRNKKNSVMRSIFISVEKDYLDMVKLLTEAYEEAGKTGVHKGTGVGLIRKSKESSSSERKVAVHKGVVSFIVAIKNHDKGTQSVCYS